MSDKQDKLTLYRILIVLLVIALGLVYLQNTQLRNEKSQQAIIAFKDQLQEGKACGLVTRGEASTMLGKDAVLESASIVSSNSPTAATRGGSPRIDGCSYVVEDSNAEYIDVIIKTYDSPTTAAKNYKDDTDKVLFITDVSTEKLPMVEKMRYASGVHYVLMDRTVYEISASKQGATSGQEQQAFSASIVTFIVTKL